MKKLVVGALTLVLTFGLTACGGSDTAEEGGSESSGGASGLITVVSREDGSGTRGAFTEITGVDDGSGDMTLAEAEIQDGTGKVMSSVESNPAAIGYISLGSLNDTVKAVTVDDVAPSVETILDGSYSVARPFNIAVKKGTDQSEVAEDFINYLFSEDAQAIVADEKFVPVEITSVDYASTTPEGTITIGGSTSVYPLMEKLKESYNEINPNATINIEGIGSSAGMEGAMDGTFDIGMASRELKEAELAELDSLVLAMDGIAVVVNNENSLSNLTLEQIRQIYVGEITLFNELN